MGVWRVLVLLVGISIATRLHAGGLWWVTVLHPAGASESTASAIDGVFQGGSATFSNTTQAALWQGTAESFVSLHPTGASQSFVSGIHENQQVGTGTFSGVRHAAMWYGTPGSFVDLHPIGADRSEARDVHGGTQVGFVLGIGNNHAALWRGSRETWVDLHPANAIKSEASAAYGTMQGGYVEYAFNQRRATVWFGSAESAIDLHPEGYARSEITGMSEDGFVGFVRDAAGGYRAGYWRAPDYEFTDLHGMGSNVWTRGYGTSRGYQVGRLDYWMSKSLYGVLWNGTPGSRVTLPPTGFYGSFAQDIEVDESGHMRIVGGTWLPSRAVMWNYAVPEPTTVTGTVVGVLSLIFVRRRRRREI